MRKATFEFAPISDADLITAVDDWLQYMQVHMGTAAQIKKRDIEEREARIRLANKAAEWAYTRRATSLEPYGLKPGEKK